jgi:hypothetical protein
MLNLIKMEEAESHYNEHSYTDFYIPGHKNGLNKKEHIVTW